MLIRLAAVTLCLFMIGAVTAGVRMRHHRPAAYPPGLYEQPVSASDSLRAEQAHEFDRYLASLRANPATRESVFHPNYSSPEAYERSKQSLLKVLCDSLGYPAPGKPDHAAPTFTLLGEDRIAKYYRAVIPVYEGVHSEGLYIVPAAPGRHPLVIAIHGAKGSPEMATFEGGANYRDLTRGAVMRGYAVWAPQHLFLAPGAPDDLRQEVDARARLVGTTVFGIELAKLHRALDVVLARPDVDPTRVAAVGHSYGALYATIAAALDSRIKVVVSSCFFGAREDRFDGTPASHATDLCFRNGQTLLRSPELVALVCPRPVLIQMGARDPLVNVETARRLLPEARNYYERAGRGNVFRYTEVDDGHEFHGEPAWDFLKTAFAARS